MKRILALFAASALLVLSLGMTACSDPGEENGETMPPVSSKAPDASVTTTEPAAQETTGDGTGLIQGGADSDKEWGPLVPIS